MTLLTSLVAIVGVFVANAYPQPLDERAVTVSNAKTSLSLVYQNNLNSSDDKNHVGALILDATIGYQAAAACAALNERLFSKATLQEHKTDFTRLIAYQDFSNSFDTVGGFHIDGGTVVWDRQFVFSSQAGSSQKRLPVLCTQSATNGLSSAGPVNGSQVAIASGSNTFVGYRNQKSFRFLGIPYANLPQRWQYSSLYTKKDQTIQATAYGSQCAQGSSGSEDCLFLNIQTPHIPKAGSKKNLRPVLFWIHGGGFTGGNGADGLSDGGNLASREDLVVVTINYRLSTLGFLAIPGTDIKGNYGIADQITALDWVIANIASFGGDPRKITIMGESAGAGSVRTLLGSPKAIGKYQGAVAMSNLGGGVTIGLMGDYGTTYSSYYTIDQSYAVAGSQILSAAGCSNSSAQDISSQVSCLSQASASKLVSLSTVARYVVQDGTYVTTPNLVLTRQNANTAHIPVMFGVTRDDGASFSTYPKQPITTHSQGLQAGLGINSTWADKIIASGLFPSPNTGNLTLDSFNVSARIATDKTFRCIDQATVYAGATSGAFSSAYYYQMDRTINGYDPNNVGGPKDRDPNNAYFRLHGADMPWVFGTLSSPRNVDDLYSVQLSTALFGAFVRTGRPELDAELLEVRGYAKVIEALNKTGQWGEVDGKKGEIRVLDWPGKRAGFVDVEQCAWLGYGLDYYLKGGA
ncbi:acetylcholinesterase precursor [Amniculicola lignicola CBS 123094]|uniref:Carboxylic ester hydrolase n=1 Tax=Amniculicola lignicola CBS 123094 TaxID=1392246 RepID=A0A6A5W649_9PLEO|nr:acetylcholinesterase precursor [Amniculicola lignicola CBS 123094]